MSELLPEGETDINGFDLVCIRVETHRCIWLRFIDQHASLFRPWCSLYIHSEVNFLA